MPGDARTVRRQAGNFSGRLIAVEPACTEWGEDGEATEQRLIKKKG